MGHAFVRSTEGLLQARKDSGRVDAVLAHGARVTWDRDEPATLVVQGDARVEIEVAGRARPLIEGRDRSEIRLTTRGESRPLVTLARYADLRASTHGTSLPEIDAAGSSRVLVLAYDCSRPRLRSTDLSMPKVVVYDRASPRCEDWPTDWEPRASDIYVGQRLECFATDREAIAAAEAAYREWARCRSRLLACLRTTGAVLRLCPNVVDFRWRDGTVHLELPGEGDPRPWYSPDAHHEEPLTEGRREACRKFYLDA